MACARRSKCRRLGAAESVRHLGRLNPAAQNRTQIQAHQPRPRSLSDGAEPGSHFRLGTGAGARKRDGARVFGVKDYLQPRPKEAKANNGPVQRGATAMQAGLTPLTFTVGPRAPPGLLAQRRRRVRDPEPGAKGQPDGWARAPHAEPAAPDAQASSTDRGPRRRREAAPEAGERSEPGVAGTNDATHSTHTRPSCHWLSAKGQNTPREGALSVLQKKPDLRVRTTAHAVRLLRGR